MRDMPMQMWASGPIMMLIFVIPFWSIFTKADFPGSSSLLMAVPIVNVITLYFLAFSRWPIHRET